MNRIILFSLLLLLSELTFAQEINPGRSSKTKSLTFKPTDEQPPKLDSLTLSEPFEANRILLNQQEEFLGTALEQMPEFPGGNNALFKFISSNLRYPERAQKQEIAGSVYVSFVVSKDGSVKDVTVAKGIDMDCNKEAVRVVESMPNWKPGKQNGKAVAVRYTLPIRFYPPEKKQK